MAENLIDLGDEESPHSRVLRTMVGYGEALTPHRLASMLDDIDEAGVEIIVRSLHEHGLVYRYPGGKSLYGVDPLAVFQQIERLEKELTDRFEAGKGQLALLRKHTRSLAVAGQYVPFPEESVCLPPELTMSYTRHAMSRAAESIAISSYRFNWFYAVEDILRIKTSAGLPLTVVIADPERAEFFRMEHKEVLQGTIDQLADLGAVIHLLPKRPLFRGSLVDGTICLLTMYDPRSETADDCTVGLHLLKETTLVSLVRHYFKTADS